MATDSLTAGEVVTDAGALLNDVTLSKYTFAIQLPYLKIAIKELRKHFELANLSATDLFSSTLTVPVANAGIIALSATTPTLPSDLVDIRVAWQAPTTTNNWVPLPRIGSIIAQLGITVNTLSGYVWEDQKMKFAPTRGGIIDIKLEYVRELFTLPTVTGSTLPIINGDTFLAARTAALVAKYVENNDERANSLNIEAGIALDEVLGIDSKGRQQMATRRRPFRAGYKSRGQ